MDHLLETLRYTGSFHLQLRDDVSQSMGDRLLWYAAGYLRAAEGTKQQEAA